MTSLRGDVVNRVRRLPKPTQAAEALQPVFEAVSNSLHAVEDAYRDEYQARGKITVTITKPRTPAEIEIIVSDNGVGLDPPRFDAFCKTDTDFKMARGGKGIGRLLWLDAFQSVRVASIYRDAGQTFRRGFTFRLEAEDQITDETIDLVEDGTTETGTVITFTGLRGNAYQTKFPIQPATIVKHFGSHFFADFILGRSPRVTVDIEGAATNFPEEIQNLRIEDRGVALISTENFGQLQLASFVCHKAASANFDGLHQMHLVANGRTVTTRKIDGLVGVGRFGPTGDSVYHGCVTGEFLDERVNQERTQFNFDETIIEEIVRACAEHGRAHAINEEVVEFDKQRLGTMQEFVDEYPSFGFEEASALLAKTPKNAVKAEEFARALIPHRIRRDQERNKRINEIVATLHGTADIPDEFAASVRKAADEIKAEEQRQLTEYVLRRKTVLEVMDVLIRRIRERGNGTQDFQLESTLHQFICPMRVRGDDPSKVEQSDHDLWVIDERLTFTKYFASDMPLSQIVEGEQSLRRPDLLIYDRLHGLGAEGEDPLKRVMLVEFKQPGRRDYDERYTPLTQISEYITKLKGGQIEDFRQGRVRVADDCIFYCYMIADIVGKLEIQTNGWRTTANGRGRIFELQGKFRGMIEIIEWADLIADARLRNHAFLHAAGLRYERHP
ncbi:MAG: ATP-binding protein [Microcystis sp. LE19-98.1E]|nr:ATP-binding protein [Brevundimonas sp.]MCZ8308665.1 ATP-binding protein [Microcystis sp. LE19-98.1E]